MRSLQGALRRSSSLAVLAAGASALVLGLAGPVAAQSIPGPLKVTDSGPSGSPGYAIKGITGFQNDAGVFGYGTAASSAINIDGVVGYVQTPQSVGTVGWSASTGTSAYGIFGHSDTGPGVFGFNANAGAASVFGEGSGFAGVMGDDPLATGVFGTTESPSTTEGFAGVGGKDFSAACCNYGTFGVSDVGGGTYGASYAAAGAGGQGLYALAANGADAIDAYQHSGGNFGIYSLSDSGFTAGWFEGGTSIDVVALNDTSSATALLATSNGVGGEFSGVNGGAATPVLAAEEGTAGMYAFSTYNNTSGNSGGPGANNESFIVSDTANASQAAWPNGSDVNISGDLYVTGFIYDNCDFSFPQTGGTAGCDAVPAVVRPTSSGTKVHAYSTTASLPTMEDFGEGRLVNGQAAIPLEHTFASTIDQTRSYLVFITPEGDSHGLFVATKSASGFTVRESMGGHSSLAFQYRIVAHPYGDNSTRLSSVVAKSRGMSAGHRLARPLAARSTQFASMVAKSKSLATKYGNRTIHNYARPTRPVMPVVNAVLRKY